MCGDPYGWMCDECFARVRENPDAELCEECKKVAERMCFCCMTQSDEPVDDHGLCINCRNEQGALFKEFA